MPNVIEVTSDWQWGRKVLDVRPRTGTRFETNQENRRKNKEDRR